MRTQPRPVLREAAAVAGRQHGNVTRRQLLALGVSRDTIGRWIAKGLLHPHFRGVYRLGHRAPSVEARYHGAVLACGEGALLAQLAAARNLGLLRSGGPPPPEVVAPSSHRIPRVVTHRTRTLHPLDAMVFRGIPTTTPAATVVDLAPRLPLEELALVCHEAEVKHRLSVHAVAAAVRRRHRVPGIANLRAIFVGDARVTLSRLEELFLGLLREESLPVPATNRKVGKRYVDCRWPQHALTIELDSFRFHHSRYAWEQDRRREREARARGDEFRRYTYGDVAEHRHLVIAELHRLLPTYERRGNAPGS